MRKLHRGNLGRDDRPVWAESNKSSANAVAAQRGLLVLLAPQTSAGIHAVFNNQVFDIRRRVCSITAIAHHRLALQTILPNSRAVSKES